MCLLRLILLKAVSHGFLKRRLTVAKQFDRTLGVLSCQLEVARFGMRRGEHIQHDRIVAVRLAVKALRYLECLLAVSHGVVGACREQPGQYHERASVTRVLLYDSREFCRRIAVVRDFQQGASQTRSDLDGVWMSGKQLLIVWD